MIFFSEEEFRGIQDCGRDEGGRFGPRNECQAPDKDGTQATAPTRSSSSWKRSDKSLSWEGKDSPLKGGENLNSVVFNSPKNISKGITKLLSKGSTVDDLVAIGGGAVRGGNIEIQGIVGGSDVVVQLEAPADPDDPDSWVIATDVTLYQDDESGGSAVSYGSLDLWRGGEADEYKWSPPDDATVSRITSIMMERMIESMMTAESKGVLLAETLAIGTPEKNDKFKGYRLWPQFGFDGELPRGVIDLMEQDIEAVGLSPEARKKWDDGEPVTIQDLIATPHGKRWWNENGSAANMTIDFRDKKSKGYKQFERMKALLPGLKRRNQNRNWFDPDTEFRDAGCGQDEKGRFAAGNKCQEDAGTATEEKPTPKQPSPKSDAWSPGKPHLTPFEVVSSNNPTKKSADGKRIESTSIKGAVVTKALGGREEVDPISVGRHLAGIQAEHRGRDIITKKKPLQGDDFEYMVSGIVSQVEAAVARGVGPNFYSPEDRKAQMDEYAKVQPLMRGGRTASGFCIGVEGPNGECEPGEGISPQAEFLFRAAQALTSPQANPFENMLRADKVLTSFFEETDPAKARLGLGISIAGPGAGETAKSFARLQKIIDKIGLEETRRLFSEPPMRAGDFERYFLDKIPGTDGDRYDPNGYAVDELVPLFSIFGPKVGPFYANNTGDTDALTADVWFTRTWGRLSGELIDKTSPDLAKKHASKLMSMTKNIPRSELASLGLDGRQFRTLVAEMKRSGVVPQAVVSWAEKRNKQYQKDGFPTPKKGTGTQERYDLDRLTVAILDNQTRVLEVPTTTVMRSNMIRVMKEAAARTGVPVAYIQDILWQDEQDAWGSLGMRTTTTPGVPSLYSDVIRKIVQDPSYRQRRNEKRSVDGVGEPAEYEFLSDQKGGVEQSLYASAVADMDDDEFADLAISLLMRNAERAEESRNFAALDAVVESRSADCGRQEGGKFGPGNQCQEEGDGPQSSRTTPHGKWNISEEPKEPSSDSRLATTHVVRLTGDDGTVKAYADVQMGGDNETLYVDFAWVAEPHRGKGVYKSLLESLQNEYTIVSDEVHNVATPVRKAYESLGAEINQYGSYELKKKKKDESRSADCGRQEGGKFGPGNQCQEDAGTATEGPPPTVQSASSRPITSGRQWKQVDGPTKFSGKDIPARSLSEVKEVVLVEGRLLSKSLRKIGVSLSDAAKVCSANSPGATVSIAHGNIKEVAEFLGDPQSHQEAKNTVTFMTTVPVSGIDNAVTVGTSLEGDDGNLFLEYIMLDVSKEARDVSPIAIAREMMRSVARSVTEAEKIGVAGVYMTAARSDGDGHDFQGYKIWPRMGFDGVIPRGHITPTWSPALGFFSPYGYSIPNRILSPRAREEKKAGKLTVQALYETKEGQEWWEKNGRGMEMSLDVGVEDSPGWQRFVKMRDRVSRRDLSDEDFFAEMGVEFRSADCGRDERLGSARRRKDNTQTKVARKIYQMGMSEKGLKQMVRDLGGKVSHTLVEIDSTHKDEGINVFIRDRDYNESLVMHIGYYGADVYVDEVKTAAEVSRIESIVKEALPKTISKRLFAGGSPYPVTVVNSPGVDSDRFLGQPRQGKSAKQRYKDEHRSADCGRQEGGKFGPRNNCAADDGGANVSGGGGGSPPSRDEKATLKSAAVRWKGSTSTLGIHMQDELAGAPAPSSASGKKLREEAAALLKEVQEKSVPAPTLYRGDDKPPSENSSPLVGWTSNRRVAEQWAREYEGEVYTLQGARGVRLNDIVGDMFDEGEEEWVVLNAGPFRDSLVSGPGLHGAPPLKRKKKDESRSADCGRDEGGKFGPNNTCQEEGEGGSSSFGSTNDNQEFKGSDKPFQGSEKFQSVRVSGGSRVSQGLKSMGLEPGDALAVATGGQAGNSVFIRPAPEHSDKGEGATLFQYERDVAGVSGGMFGSTVVANAGTKDSPEIVVYHSVAEVDDSIRKDDAKRHAAAREFYRTMTGSIEEAIRKGAKRVTLNAAGSAKGQNAFRGYTIWPRMGFDAPIPHHLKQKLPESLSHAKSLLDLHATPEGTRWWRDNGIDVDVSFDLTDQSSPQFKIMEKFRRKFGTERRDMPLGSGGEWLSPGDLALLDELWEEIWDDGDLDDYEWVERRSADCGRDEGGKFGPKNTCQEDGNVAAAASSTAAKKLKSDDIAKAMSPSGPAGDDPKESLALLSTPRRFELMGSVRRQMNPREPAQAAKFAKDFLSQEATFSPDFTREVSRRVESSIRIPSAHNYPSEAADNAAALVSMLSAASREAPEVGDVPLVAMNSMEVFNFMISEGQNPISAAEFATTSAAFYDVKWDKITVNTDAALGFMKSIADNETRRDKNFSSSQLGHALVHEDGHRIHFQALREVIGAPLGRPLTSTQLDAMTEERKRRLGLAGQMITDAIGKKIVKLSKYGATLPTEFVAEYYAGLRLGAVKRDRDLDELAEVLGFPKSKLPEGKKRSRKK